MKLANCKTMSYFLKKCVFEKEIYIVDLEPFRDLQWLLSNVTSNINQIAKATNTTGVIYKNEIESMNKEIRKDNPNYGYRRIHAMLRRLGVLINKKKVQRLIQKLKLQVTNFSRKSRKYYSYKGTVG